MPGSPQVQAANHEVYRHPGTPTESAARTPGGAPIPSPTGYLLRPGGQTGAHIRRLRGGPGIST